MFPSPTVSADPGANAKQFGTFSSEEAAALGIEPYQGPRVSAGNEDDETHPEKEPTISGTAV